MVEEIEYPERTPAISSLDLKTADGINTINSITKENNIRTIVLIKHNKNL